MKRPLNARGSTAHAIVKLLAIGVSLLTSAVAEENGAKTGLVHDDHTRSAVPIPPSEQTLPTVQAEPWFKVSDEGLILEGAVFDGDGNLLFCDVSGRRVLRITAEKKLSTLVVLDAMSPGGLALHKDGRLFIAALDPAKRLGAIYAVTPDGSNLQTIVPALAGFMPNDLVFDSSEGFYFTDFKGAATEPAGGVYYASPGFTQIKEVIPRLAMANGIALSSDRRTLWVTEFARNVLHRAELTDATNISFTGSTVAYHFVGPAPDSMRADDEGNVYVAIYGQGRVLAFNANGIPIGQILLPERETGHHLASTSLAIRTGRRDLYVVSNDGKRGKGSTIFKSKAFGRGLGL